MIKVPLWCISGVDSLPDFTVCSLCPHGAKRGSQLSGASYTGLNHILRAPYGEPLLNLIISQRPCLQTQLLWELRLQHVKGAEGYLLFLWRVLGSLLKWARDPAGIP